MGRRLAPLLWWGWLVMASAAAAAMAAPVPAPAPAGSSIVESVELHLPRGGDASGLTELVAVRRGQLLTQKAVRRSVERLFSTGRFADVVVRAYSAEHGVRVVFELSMLQPIRGVKFSGERVLPEEILARTARLGIGEAYSPERVADAEEALLRAYRERGYDHARVRIQVQPDGDGVVLQFRVAEGDPTRLAGVSVAGAPGLPLGRVLATLGLRPGDVLDRVALAEGIDRVKALYRNEHFYQIRMGDPSFAPSTEGPWLTIPVTAGPRFTIHFVGQRSFPEELLRGVLGYEGQETLDRGLLASLARKIETFYRFRGFNEVRVHPRLLPVPRLRSAVIVFEVQEGRQLELRSLRFDGNTQRSDAELAALVHQLVADTRPSLPTPARVREDPLQVEGRTATEPDTAEPPPEPRQAFVEDAFRQAAENLTNRYHEEGFLGAKVTLESMSVQVGPDVGDVRFLVQEGTQTRIRSVEVVHPPPEFLMPPLTTLAPGEPLRESAVEETRLELIRLLGRGGWLFARVDAETPADSGGRLADVRFKVEAGPRVRVGQVVVQGIRDTREALVRAHVLLKPGAPLDPEALFETQRRLVALGLFRQVVVRFLSPDTVEPVKDIVVEVRERPRLSGEVSGGYSLADGPRVIVDATYPNLGGHGLTLAGRGQVNYVGASTQVLTRFFDPQQLQGVEGLAGRGSISLQQQRIYPLLPTEVGARMDLIAERVLRPSYRFTRYAAIAGLSWLATRWLSISLSYELEQDRVQAAAGVVSLLPQLVRGDVERLRFPVGVFNLQTLAPTFTLDFRDNPSNPSRGALVVINTELTKDLGAKLTDPTGTVDIGTTRIFYFKASANVTGYIPVGGNVVLAVSARAGRIFRIDPNSTTIAPKRFFLGGATSLRGFREDGLLPEDRRIALHDEVRACRALANPGGCTPSALALLQGNQLPSEGGELFTLAKAELRIPVYGSFALGLFGEVGNLWLDVHAYNPLSLRYVAGIGIRYLTPVGPLALDLGFNVVPDTLVNENNPSVQFSVGLF